MPWSPEKGYLEGMTEEEILKEFNHINNRRIQVGMNPVSRAEFEKLRLPMVDPIAGHGSLGGLYATQERPASNGTGLAAGTTGISIAEVADLLRGGGAVNSIPMTAGGYDAGLTNFQNSPGSVLYSGTPLRDASTGRVQTDPLTNFQNSAAYKLFNGLGTPSANTLTNFQNSALFKQLHGNQAITGNPLTDFRNSAAYKLNNGMNANSNDPLANFRNSGEYRLAYGNNATSADPSVNFANDPGIQQAVKQGMIPLLGKYAAAGLGESGAISKALTDYMYNHYSDYTNRQGQMYNNYQNVNRDLFNNQQAQDTNLLNNYLNTNLNLLNNDQTARTNLFSNYQDRLAAMTQFGAQNSGSQNAFNQGLNLANLLAGANLTTGQNIANANLTTGQNIANANLTSGENIASLLGNQGVLNAGAYLNTGAAQANNLFQGLSLLTQVNANNQASNAQSQNSMIRGQGAMAGASKLGGGLF